MSQEKINGFIGLNPVSAPQTLQEGYVQAGSNVDFSLERGAALARRGSERYWVGSNTSPIIAIFRHYNNPTTPEDSPIYVSDAAGNTWRGVGGTYTAIASGGGEWVGYGSYDNYVLIANGTNHLRDDGTNAVEWLKQVPTHAPTLGSNTLGDFVVGTVYTVTEGTLVGSGTNTATATVATASDQLRYRIQFNVSRGTATNMTTNGTYVIGSGGMDVVYLKISNPGAVTKISRDYSIGGTAYTSYFHTEIIPDTSDDWMNFKDTFFAWPVVREAFTLNAPASQGWENIACARILLEATEPINVEVTNWVIRGADSYPILSTTPYRYRETWATIDAEGNVIGEGAPGPESQEILVAGVQIKVVSTDTPTGTNHGITHRLFYRQGGDVPVMMRVGSLAIASTTFMDILSDQDVMEGGRELEENVVTALSSNVVTLSEPFKGRVFAGYDNNIAWTTPGMLDQFLNDSETTISHKGDKVVALHVWDRLVIVCQDSVWEMDGNYFEGSEADWTLQRSGSRRGSKAPRTAIETPHGILLLDYDGISMYLPGRGIDSPVDWVNEGLADAFRGTATTDPAYLKGGRCPAINKSAIDSSCAAWSQDKLYLAVPTGSATAPDTVFVLDFRAETGWYYKYPFYIQSLFWDMLDNRLLAGTEDGKVMRLEVGEQDSETDGSATPVAWMVRTRAWTSPNDSRMENINLEVQGTGSVKVILDGTSTQTLGTYSASNYKFWAAGAMDGAVGNNVVFEVGGVASVTGANEGVWGIQWEAITEPSRLTYYQTPPTQGEGEQWWQDHYATIEAYGTGTVLGTVYIDNVAVTTHTFVSPTSGKATSAQAYPQDTFGYIQHTVWNCSTGVQFKVWKDWSSSSLTPPMTRTEWVVTYRKIGGASQFDMARFYQLDVEPEGTATVTCKWDVDGTAVLTNTHTFTGRTWVDNVPFPPGVRGYLFRNHLTSSQRFRVWASTLDMERVGVKGLSRTSLKGLVGGTGE